MEYAVDMISGAMIYIPRFLKTGLDIQKLIHTHTQHLDRISLFLFF
jgi:hypothetical protein